VVPCRVIRGAERALDAFRGDVGKIPEDSAIAAALAAMVVKHPPDWDKMEIWDYGSGGYIGAAFAPPVAGTDDFWIYSWWRSNQ
jgi:hypothetical protein